ncbi:MAG TPA: hypothetical protein VJV23_13690 [Candidatus Polarisedimenticolia bacterium]|nr:hypothetical protein [Candidatus Polarisedimenticolia bacterium]
MDRMELLEEKIRKAVDEIRGLREERSILEGQLRSARDEIRRLSVKKDDEVHVREKAAIAERVERMIALIEEAQAH